MEKDNFCEFVEHLNNVCKERQDIPKEIISHETAFMAYTCVKNMLLRDSGDALLFCAAMNLLNTYVKQKDSMVGYSFKKELGYLFGIQLNRNIRDVTFDLQTDNKTSLLVVQICSIQFSFHQIFVTKELKQVCNERNSENRIAWDGIRKQMCAYTVYRLALENRVRRCEETFRGKNLDKKIENIMEKYRKGTISFSDVRYI